MANTFSCSECGLCCQHIGGIKDLESFDRGDGVCRYLWDNKCLIYDQRPEICRVDMMYEKVYQAYFTRQEFYRENEKICKELQRQHEMIEEDS